MADLTGQQLGQYTIGDLIGRGGMAQVYRARQVSMDRDVAIKVMASELTNNAEFVTRFEREARVIARLQHPHILPVIDFGRSGPHVYLVMRLIGGGVLSERMLHSPLTIQQCERLLSQIASALEYAHRNGVVHRDLKPTNVLLDEQDNVYLTDFGIAKMLAGSTSNYSLTATGRVMGTPAYMAPEQWRSDPVDARTDIYALGVILYEMLLGALPFNSDTPYGMMYKHFDTPPPPPRAVNPLLPDALERVVLRALAKQPDQRYPSAQQMADEFSAATRTLPPDVLAQPLPRASAEQIERATPRSGERAIYAEAGTVPPGGFGAPPTTASPGGDATLARPGRAGGRRRGGFAVIGVILLLVAVGAVLAALLLNGGDDDPSDGIGTDRDIDLADATATATQSGIVQLITPRPTGTPTATVIESPTPPATDTPTSTTVPSATDTALPPPSVTPEPTATHTIAPTDTATVMPTDTPTATLTPSATPDFDATAEVLVAQRLTQTAESWTDTPTPDIEASVIAALTGTASMWTATLTATPTVTTTPSNTPSATLPPPPSATHTPTRTLSPTRTPSRTPTRTPFPTPTLNCSALPMRMTVGEGGRTTLLPAVPTRIRRYPGTNESVVRSIPPGLMFDVIGGPQCANGITWWMVEGYDQDGPWMGWIGEGLNGQYWIEPQEDYKVECPGAPPPRLVPGERGRVKVVPPAPNRVRSEPRVTNFNVLGQIEPGQDFEVISGPVCDPDDRQWRWWYVRKGTLVGWTAEGQPGEYWLEPWP